MTGEFGDDYLYGGGGNDELFDSWGTSEANGNDYMSGGDGNDTISTSSGADRIFAGAGNDHVWVYDAANRGGPVFEVHGGSGTDTLHMSVPANTAFTFVGLPYEMSGFERIDIEDSTSGELILSLRDVIDVSDTDLLTIDGDFRDRVRLEDDVAGDGLTGGTWVQGLTYITSDPTESFTRFSYELNGNVLATVSIDTDVDVWLV